jgi:hypothetical protein
VNDQRPILTDLGSPKLVYSPINPEIKIADATNSPPFDAIKAQNTAFSEIPSDKKLILSVAYIVGAINVLGAFAIGVYLLRALNRRHLLRNSNGNSN